MTITVHGCSCTYMTVLVAAMIDDCSNDCYLLRAIRMIQRRFNARSKRCQDPTTLQARRTVCIQDRYRHEYSRGSTTSDHNADWSRRTFS